MDDNQRKAIIEGAAYGGLRASLGSTPGMAVGKATAREAEGGDEKAPPNWKKSAQGLLRKSEDSARMRRDQDGSGYRTYLRAVVGGNPADHLLRKSGEAKSGAKAAHKALVAAAGAKDETTMEMDEVSTKSGTATIKVWLTVLSGAVTSYDRQVSKREKTVNIYRIGHLLDAVRNVEKSMRSGLDKDLDKAAMGKMIRAMKDAFVFEGGRFAIAPLNKVVKKMEDYVNGGTLPKYESTEEARGDSSSTPFQCEECGKKFKKKLSKTTVDVKCPKCGGYDTLPTDFFGTSSRVRGQNEAVDEKHEEPTKSGAELDMVTKAPIKWRAGMKKMLKKNINRRARQAGKQDVQKQMDESNPGDRVRHTDADRGIQDKGTVVKSFPDQRASQVRWDGGKKVTMVAWKVLEPLKKAVKEVAEPIMEPGFVKTPSDEKNWDKAKDAAGKQDADKPYALANHIFHKMKGEAFSIGETKSLECGKCGHKFKVPGSGIHTSTPGSKKNTKCPKCGSDSLFSDDVLKQMKGKSEVSEAKYPGPYPTPMAVKKTFKDAGATLAVVKVDKAGGDFGDWDFYTSPPMEGGNFDVIGKKVGKKLGLSFVRWTERQGGIQWYFQSKTKTEVEEKGIEPHSFKGAARDDYTGPKKKKSALKPHSFKGAARDDQGKFETVEERGAETAWSQAVRSSWGKTMTNPAMRKKAQAAFMTGYDRKGKNPHPPGSPEYKGYSLAQHTTGKNEDVEEKGVKPHSFKGAARDDYKGPPKKKSAIKPHSFKGTARDDSGKFEDVEEGTRPDKYTGEGAWKMTMAQWKTIHRERKGKTDGKRSATTMDPKTGATISVPVEIVKESRPEVQWQEDFKTILGEASDPPVIQQLRKIVSTKSMGKVGGSPMDLYTASAIVSVYDKLSGGNKSSMAKMPVRKMADVAFKLVKKAGR